jgi:hypothetical protein
MIMSFKEFVNQTNTKNEGQDDGEPGDKEAYKKFFEEMLAKFGVESPDELDIEKKKEFFDAIDAGWKADKEED